MANQDAWTVSQEYFLDPLHIGDAIITACNGAAAELYGFESPAQLNGRFLSELTNPDDRVSTYDLTCNYRLPSN